MDHPACEPSPTEFFFAHAHAAAAALKLAYALEQGHELALLVGEPGLGKSRLLRQATANAAAAGDAVVDVYFSRLDADSLLAFLEGELAQRDDAKQPMSRAAGCRTDSLQPIARHVRRLSDAGRGIVIAIDDAHLIRDPAVFETLQLLLNLRDREHARLTILLAGQRSLLADLSRTPALAQRVAVTASLAPLDVGSTSQYVQARLQFDHDGEIAINDDAVELLHDAACGVPRHIDRLCAMARLIAELDNRCRISVADVGEVALELGLRDAAA